LQIADCGLRIEVDKVPLRLIVLIQCESLDLRSVADGTYTAC